MNSLFIRTIDHPGECPVVRHSAIDTQSRSEADRDKPEIRSDDRPDNNIFELARVISYRAVARKRVRRSFGII
jgi:hypothetical protein